MIVNYPNRVSVMGVPIDPFTMQETVCKACDFVEAKVFAHLIGVNADKYLQMRDSEEMDAIVRKCELINADGASMVMAAKTLGVEIPERVAGIDLMYELCSVSAKKGYRIYLLGAKREIVEKAKTELEGLYPGIEIAGIRDGYFPEDEFDSVASQVNSCNPDIVFVGITSPKKERLIEYFRKLNMKGVYVGVGGTFDVVSGSIPRAPQWMQRARLEWLFRLSQEPGRLLKRYAVGNTRFLLCVQQEKRKRKVAQR